MTARWRALALIPLACLAFRGAAGAWTPARIRQLPDSAFAVVETTPEGGVVRHLPHHDESGAVEAAHLRAARARLHQVRWLDPSSAEAARQHLEAHWRALRGRPISAGASRTGP